MAVWIYGYNALDQLRSVRYNGAVIARYAYDVLGRRIAKRVYSTVTGGTVDYRRFVYHGGHVAFETDSAGTIGLRYTWGADTDELVGIRDAAGNQYYTVSDKLGSIRGLVKRDGTWVLSRTYRPWGAALDSAGTQHGLLRYRWTGREFDAETGWYFHRTRYYSPAARRFVQEDAIGYAGGSNLYAYVGGQVLEATDPSGLIWKHEDGGNGSRTWTPDYVGGGRYDGIGNRFDTWGTSYITELAAKHMAEYDQWAAAGGYVTASGKRALTTPVIVDGYDPDPVPGLTGLLAAAGLAGRESAGVAPITTFGVEPNLRKGTAVVQFNVRVTSSLEGVGTRLIEGFPGPFGLEVNIYSFHGELGVGLYKTPVTGTIVNIPSGTGGYLGFLLPRAKRRIRI